MSEDNATRQNPSYLDCPECDRRLLAEFADVLRHRGNEEMHLNLGLLIEMLAVPGAKLVAWKVCESDGKLVAAMGIDEPTR